VAYFAACVQISSAIAVPAPRIGLTLDVLDQPSRQEPSVREGQKSFRNRLRLARSVTAGSIIVVLAAAIGEWSTGLSATYFDDDRWEHAIYTVVDRQIDSDALAGSAPVSPDKPFTVRWFGSFNARRSGWYAFTLTAQGTAGLVLERASSTGASVFSVVTDAVDLNEGPHAIAVFYRHTSGRYGIDLRVATDGGAWATVPSEDLAPGTRSAFAFRTIRILVVLAQVVVLGWAAIGGWWLLRRVSWPVGAALLAVTLLLVAGLVTDSPSWLRGPYPGQWQWVHRSGDNIGRIGPAAVGALGVVLAVAFLSATTAGRNERARARLGLTFAMAAGLMLQLGVLHLGQGGAIASAAASTRDDIVTGYFDVAAKPLSTPELLDKYAAMLPTLPVHPRAHPPGPVLYYRAIMEGFDAVPRAATTTIAALARVRVPIERFAGGSQRYSQPVLQASAVVGGLGTLMLNALTCCSIAGVARAAGANARDAARAGALWMVVPAVLFFLPSIDVLTTLLTTTSCLGGFLALTATGDAESNGWAIAAGGFAGTALFCSIGAAPMLAAAAILIALGARGPHVGWRRVTRALLLAAVSLVSVFAVPIALGFDPLETAQRAVALHRDHYLQFDRSLWLRFNLLDFSVFLGWPLTAWLGLLAWRGRNTRKTGLLFALAAILIAIDLSDITRSETGRLWMPLMPLALATTGVAASSDEATSGEWTLVATLLAITSMALVLYWAP
jgi:hypothetical protein